jgi:MoaD family protein
MIVVVKFFASLREITGKREEKLEMGDEATVEMLLQRLVQKYGAKFEDYVYDAETKVPRESLQFLVDGKSITALGGMKTKLYDGCHFAIIPPVGGG